MTTYLPIGQFEAANLGSCGDGLFQGRSEQFSNVFVWTSGDVRTLIYLEGPHAGLAIPMEKSEERARPGILWPSPTFEVDPATLFNPDRYDGRPGDLILDSEISIATRAPDSWSHSVDRTPVGTSQQPGMQRLGFRGWRLVKVNADERRVLFTMVPVQEKQV